MAQQKLITKVTNEHPNNLKQFSNQDTDILIRTLMVAWKIIWLCTQIFLLQKGIQDEKKTMFTFCEFETRGPMKVAS